MERNFEQVFSETLRRVVTVVEKAYAHCVGPEERLNWSLAVDAQHGLDSLGVEEFKREIEASFDIEEIKYIERDLEEGVNNRLTLNDLSVVLASRHIANTEPNREAKTALITFNLENGMEVSSTLPSFPLEDVDAFITAARYRLQDRSNSKVTSAVVVLTF